MKTHFWPRWKKTNTKHPAAHHACAQKCASTFYSRNIFAVFCSQFTVISLKTRFRRSVRNRYCGKNAPCFARIWKTTKMTPKCRAEKTLVFCECKVCIKNLLSTPPPMLSRKVEHFCTIPIFCRQVRCFFDVFFSKILVAFCQMSCATEKGWDPPKTAVKP